MSNEPGHPDDATLFDLLEGALDPAREPGVIAHLERCAACAAFVDAARAGAPETTTAVVAMPEPAAERMRLRLAEGWRERTAAIAAAEARADAAAPAPITVPPPQPLPDADADLIPPRLTPPSTSRQARGGWRRALVPALAFAVLATLAGTSIWVGQHSTAPATRSAGDAATATSGDSFASSDAAAPGSDEAASGGAAAPAVGAAGSPAEVAPQPATGETSSQDLDGRTVTIPPEATDKAAEDAVAPPVGYTDIVAGELCTVAFSRLQLVLPDGRIPQQVFGPGPFGTFVVCG
jgi:hypothetical protein